MRGSAFIAWHACRLHGHRQAAWPGLACLCAGRASRSALTEWDSQRKPSNNGARPLED